MHGNSTPGPFGRPFVVTRPLVTRLHRSGCGSPYALWAALRGTQGHEGMALLESGGAGVERAAIRRTLLIPRPLLRLRLDGTHACIEPLNDSGSPLVDLLRPHLDLVTSDETGLEDLDHLRSPSVLDLVRRVAGSVADHEPVCFPPGLFGAFSYELVDRFEPLGPRNIDPLQEPDGSFVLGADMVLEDLADRSVSIITRGMPWEEAQAVESRHQAMVGRMQDPGLREPALAGPGRCVPVRSGQVEDSDFISGVRKFQDQIDQGDIFQGVLSRSVSIPSQAEPGKVYEVLRRNNPSPYMFYLELGDGVLLGASPETFLRVEGGHAEIRPIAGTAPRGLNQDGGIDEDLDGRLALGLLLDPKEQAEHAMLLDLARNDIARIAEPGTTRVVQQFAIERYSHVQHIVSKVRGQVRSGLDALHVYRAAANMGTLTGAPKPRAMALIREQETEGRGFYGGAAGYLLQDGRFETCIVIRSLRYKQGAYHIRAGAGIVRDSDPARELQETEQKLSACRQAVDQAGEVSS